jgi:hypothetical protein
MGCIEFLFLRKFQYYVPEQFSFNYKINYKFQFFAIKSVPLILQVNVETKAVDGLGTV